MAVQTRLPSMSSRVEHGGGTFKSAGGRRRGGRGWIQDLLMTLGHTELSTEQDICTARVFLALTACPWWWRLYLRVVSAQQFSVGNNHSVRWNSVHLPSKPVAGEISVPWNLDQLTTSIWTFGFRKCKPGYASTPPPLCFALWPFGTQCKQTLYDMGLCCSLWEFAHLPWLWLSVFSKS